MIVEDLAHFLKFGALKHFPFGTPKKLILQQLGQTVDRIENKNTSLLKYGRTEFYFEGTNSKEMTLNGVMIQPVTAPSDSLNLEMDCDWLESEKTLAQTAAMLDERGIETTKEVAQYDDSEMLVTTGNVQVLFFEEDGTICKAGKFV